MPDSPSAHPPAPPAALDPLLWRALGFGEPSAGRPPVAAIVGAGGKTSLVYRLGREAGALGRRVVLCGTARYTGTEHADQPLVLRDAEERLPARVVAAWARGVGTVIASGVDRERPARLVPLSPATIAALARLPGLDGLFIEADGSRMLPFKAPAEHEPAIPAAATHVVALVGLDALDAPLDAAHVHRPERVRAICDRPTCDADLIARVLASAQGGRKHVDGRAFAVVVNKADLDRAGALRLADRIAAMGVPRVVVAQLRNEATPVVAVIAPDGAGA